MYNQIQFYVYKIFQFLLTLQSKGVYAAVARMIIELTKSDEIRK